MCLILRIMQTFLKYHISFEIKKKKKKKTLHFHPLPFLIFNCLRNCRLPRKIKSSKTFILICPRNVTAHTPILIT